MICSVTALTHKVAG